VPNTNDDSLLP